MNVLDLPFHILVIAWLYRRLTSPAYSDPKVGQVGLDQMIRYITKTMTSLYANRIRKERHFYLQKWLYRRLLAYGTKRVNELVKLQEIGFNDIVYIRKGE
jgi:hypothetical protein